MAMATKGKQKTMKPKKGKASESKNMGRKGAMGRKG